MSSLFELKKIVVIVIALAIFIAVLAFIIAPSQGGLKSSTELKADDLNVTSFTLNDTLLNPGTFFLVMDNSERPLGGLVAAPDGVTSNITFHIKQEMTVDLPDGSGSFDLLMVALVIGAVVLLVLTMYVAYRSIKLVKGKKTKK